MAAINAKKDRTRQRQDSEEQDDEDIPEEIGEEEDNIDEEIPEEIGDDSEEEGGAMKTPRKAKKAGNVPKPKRSESPHTSQSTSKWQRRFTPYVF